MDWNTITVWVLGVTIFCIVLYFRRWKSYNPGWLVKLAKEQYPEDVKLHEALKQCTKIKGNYFVDPSNPNKPGSDWQFEESVILVHPEKGEIVLDILKDGRVGSIEYLGLMLKKKSKGK